jgi:hypothetical protein
MSKPMHVDEFLSKLNDVLKYKTVYLWGTFGQFLTKNLITNKTHQYPSFYNHSNIAEFNAKAVTMDHFAFDCVGLIKGILWGWNGDKTKALGGCSYPTATQPQSVGDINANMMFNLCTQRSTDFSKIQPGWFVHSTGHIGVYVGAGVVIEATNAFTRNVLRSACLNIRPIDGLPGRRWTSCGKPPASMIDMTPKAVVPKKFYKIDMTLTEAIVRSSVNSPESWLNNIAEKKKNGVGIDRFLGEYTLAIWNGRIAVGGLTLNDSGENVKQLQKLLNMANSKAPGPTVLEEDGQFGPTTLAELKAFLSVNGLPNNTNVVSTKAEELLNIAALIRTAYIRGKLK